MAAFLYLRCNGGHYFTGSSVCPFDGWSADAFDKAVLAAVALADRGVPPSIEALRDHGVPEETLARAAVFEFPSDEPAFEALDPAGYLVDGEWTPINRAGPELK
ncbi:MAG TPA: hypothetical protein VF986_06735 [Actinomycetota bacterium]